MCEVQYDWHKAHKDKVCTSNNGQKQSRLSKLGTTQDKLEKHLKNKNKTRFSSVQVLINSFQYATSYGIITVDIYYLFCFVAKYIFG